ncbi:MAG: PEP/pyruvate-binding domain-containing protein, partial [Lachnoanaerobaculum saburreum]
MILGFNEICKEDVIKVGGKGANLGEMVSAGINVPKGFVITADAYKEFLRINSLNELLKDELTKAGRDHAKLLKAAEKFRKSIKMGRLPENTVNEVKSAYQNLGENILVAVRSSATAEDLSDASFAGQQESYLNIRGIDDVLDKIRDCYASLWGNRAVIYRANQNYNQLFVEIAVVIQEMVESEKAGVLFTLNPINNNTDEMQINSSYGLGESVVSGRVNADSYIVDKFGRIKYINIGSKQTKIIYDKNANKEVEVSKELREKASLNENEVLKLVKVAKALKEHYRQDMDIEWAIKEGEVYILQARAVTTIKKNNDSELVKPYIKDIVMSKMLRKQMAFQLEKMPFAYRALDYDYMIGINNQKAIIFNEAGINLNSNPQIDDDGIQTMPKDSKGINRNIFKLFKTIKMLKDYKYCAKKCEAFMIDYENKISELKELDFENMGMEECRKFLIYSLELLKSLSYDRFKYALFPSALNKDLEKVLKRIN